MGKFFIGFGAGHALLSRPHVLAYISGAIGFLLSLANCFRPYLRKRRALRVLEHAKFYLFARSSYMTRNHAAIHIITDLIFRVMEER
jgi:uncharacterized membrane protein YhhN